MRENMSPAGVNAVAIAVGLMCLLAIVGYSACWPDAPLQQGDSSQYMEVARDLADGRLDDLHFRTPGYPLVLALTGSAVQPTRVLFLVSLLLHAATVALIANALRVAGAPSAFVIACAGLLLLPPYVEPAAYVMTENLAAFCLVLGFWSLVRWHQRPSAAWALSAGVAFAIAPLVRPVYLLLAPLVAIFMAVGLAGTRGDRSISTHRRRSAVYVALVWALVLGAFATHNFVRFQWFGIAPSAGLHFSTKTMAFIERLPDDYAPVREILIRARDAELVKRGGTHTATQAIWSARPELEAVTGLRLPELSAYLVRVNLTAIRHAPLEYLQEVARSSVIYWFPASGRLASFDSAALRWLWFLLHMALVILAALQLAVLIGLGALALTTSHAGRRLVSLATAPIPAPQPFAFSLALLIVGYTMALSCALDIGEPRQRQSTDALFVFACVLGTAVWSRLAQSLDVRGE
jgi:hypothetical protein